jgi:hypothetical protein
VNGGRVLEPSSNTWLGPGRSFELPHVEADCLFQVSFRIESRSDGASLSLNLEGSGTDAPQVQAILSVWSNDNVTYSLTEQRVRRGGNLAVPHVVTVARPAERVQLPDRLKDHDWSKGSEVTLKRDGGSMQFFVNRKFVQAFDVPLFAVSEWSIGAAFPSKIVVSSAEMRVRP